MPSKEEAQQYLRSIVRNHIPSNANQYKFVCYNGERNISSMLGFQMDLSPADGKVVDKNDDWLVVRTKRTEFFIAAIDLLDLVPEIGATVHIEPYARRGFDGIRLDAPKETDYGNGVRMQTFTLGESVSRLPIDKASLKSTYLKDMINQIEQLPSPDGVRKLGQVLVDAGAYLGPVSCHDPDDLDCITVPPSLSFTVSTEKFNGVLQIVYDRGMDLYQFNLIQDQQVVQHLEDITFDDLGRILIDLVDDGKWKLAKVTVVKPAAKQRPKAVCSI